MKKNVQHKIEVIDNLSGKSRIVNFSNAYYNKLAKAFEELNSSPDKLIYV
ncbi:MAG: hypothetical protein LBS76_04355 [Mycoplasmataceae bacterium]|jgi:hypothetical protein|nr:hypothetical protein [Mycoplasmataceae bacterium]